MPRSFRLLLCASTAALILGAAPVGGFIAPAQAQVDVVISASVPPPALPIYAQPPIPGPGYIWIPGYWAWDGAEYYWVPGYWALPPAAALYWTPGHWAWDDADNDYVFYAGYWGPTVGYYGGIDYGYGYTGEGYHGGYWRNRQFFYNKAVNNLGGLRIANVFSQPVPAAQPGGPGFNGGHGGTTVRPTQQQLAFAREHHIGPTPAQTQHVQLARQTPALRFNQNHGAPAIAATDKPGTFHGPHVIAASGAGARGGPREHPAAGAAVGAAAGALAAHGAMNRPPVVAHEPGTAANLAARHAGPTHGPAMTRGLAAREATRTFGPQHHFGAAAPMRGEAMQHSFAALRPVHSPAARQNFAAYRPPARAPAAPRNFAHAPRLHPGGAVFGGLGAARPGPMRFGGGGFGGGPRIGAPGFGTPRIGGMATSPHFGGGPRFGGMGGAPHFGGGAPHLGGGPHGGAGPRIP